MLSQDTCADGPCEPKRGPQLWQKPTRTPTPLHAQPGYPGTGRGQRNEGTKVIACNRPGKCLSHPPNQPAM